jgi:ATP-dependent Clp protease ATP-binding subunit ClpC
MFEYFTDQTVKVVMLAQEEARQLNQTSVGTEQLLLGLLRENTSIAAKLLADVGITLKEAQKAVLEISGRGNGPVPSDIPFTPKTKQILEQALQEAQGLSERYIAPHHLLLAITTASKSVAVQVLLRLGIDPAQLRTTLIQTLGEAAVPAGRGGSDRRGSGNSRKGSALAEFGTNLTQLAQDGKLDPVVGRDMEIERVLQILGRRTKSNPILLGEPGVGKTAIAEGLAQRIASQQVPEHLYQVEVIALQMSDLVAGARLRGDFEERLTQVVAEVKQAGNIVLVIDEIHTVIGGGAFEGSTDAANLLKPALARGELQCIGATTLDEYRKYIERDEALARRFQPVKVGEPSVQDTIEILHGLRQTYETHHRVQITNGALEAAAKLSHRYISDRFLPDKAIDLIDEAGSRMRMGQSQSTVKQALKQQLRQIAQDKQKAADAQEYETAGQLRDQELQLEAQLKALMEQEKQTGSVLTVDAEEIAQVVSIWTGVPVTRMTESESAKFLNLDGLLHERVIGQNEAVKAVAQAMGRSRSGLKNPQRPIASLIFAGPTGVGKTELAKALTMALFNSEDALIRVDMSELMDRHEVSKLIGSPPGFVGYEDGGKLTEAVRRRPYSVILFDEIEKAHPDIFNLLLQLLDEGHLTDAKGRQVDFKNTVIILTSNLGAKAIEKGGKGLGFELVTGDLDESRYQLIRGRVMDEMKQFFRPEFINRVDDIVVFRQLTEPEVGQIADLMLEEVSQRLGDRQITLEVTESFKALVVKQGYDPAYGARPLRRAIMRLLEDSLAEAILLGTVKSGDTAIVDVDDTETVTIRQKQAVLALVG